jgi:hypothetical protein
MITHQFQRGDLVMCVDDQHSISIEGIAAKLEAGKIYEVMEVFPRETGTCIQLCGGFPAWFAPMAHRFVPVDPLVQSIIEIRSKEAV